MSMKPIKYTNLEVELVAAAEVGNWLEHDGAEVELDGGVHLLGALQEPRVVADVPAVIDQAVSSNR